MTKFWLQSKQLLFYLSWGVLPVEMTDVPIQKVTVLVSVKLYIHMHVLV